MSGLTEQERADVALYVAAVERYGRDTAFQMKADRVRAIIATAEPEIDPAALTGALWGAVTALQLVDTERAKFNPAELAEELNENLRGLSDVIKGGVATLVAEGFEEEMARAMVLSIMFRSMGGQA